MSTSLAGSATGVPAKPTGPAFSHRCQRCDAHLRIVDDLPFSADVSQSFRESINEAFVVVPGGERDEFVEGGPAVRRTMNESFIVVPDVNSEFSDPVDGLARRDGAAPGSCGPALPPSAIGSSQSASVMDQVARVENIIKLASGQTDQDHPVCAECRKAVVQEVQKLVDAAQADHRAYTEAHAMLQERLAELGSGENRQLEAELVEMEAEEQRLLDQLKSYENEERELGEDLERLRKEEEELQREEEELWLVFAEYQLDLEESEEERAATASAIRYATSELDRLQRTNVLNDMFHIANHGQFGTINKFRMGRFPDPQTPWEEINAAWGQACLLLDALVKKLGMGIGNCRLLPRGSFSSIQVGNEVHNLYFRDGGLTGFWTQRNFDSAMVDFLGCMETVTRFLQRDPKVTKLPYKIEGDKVGGFSIKYLFSQPERWTKALKFMLADLKWLIAFVESRERHGSSRGAVTRSISAF